MHTDFPSRSGLLFEFKEGCGSGRHVSNDQVLSNMDIGQDPEESCYIFLFFEYRAFSYGYRGQGVSYTVVVRERYSK
jgi:hypothetical protein